MLITDPLSLHMDSYASVAVLRDLAGARGYDIPADDDECERLLIQAMDYLAGLKWKGQRGSASQPNAWPRSGVEVDGFTLSPHTIPVQLIQAQCRLAIEAQNTDLQPATSGGAEVLQESVSGAVSITYAEGTSRDPPSFPWLSGLLRGMVAGFGQVSLVRG
ncbi:hypothetical protein CQW29_18410 [Pantoea coffeiphila]|uniref:Putative DnaT-like domain-containing protein n=2 Tax=Pantoea coffeiphila TaxID=1465635 RepID=A0A2S9I861_9GAMM|nr:hypothetical protein CQW29_18410 [Pantoea coffeiphila]